MSFISTGKLLGKLAGAVIGEPIKFVGKKIESDLLTDIGEGAKKASEFTGDLVGQVADGAWDTVAGIVGNDPFQRDKGLGEIGEAIGRTGRGIVQTGKAIYQNSKDVYIGFKEGNEEQWKTGVSGIVKTAAVTTLAVGIFDFVDGPDTVEAAHTEEAAPTIDPSDATQVNSINADLAQSTHPETGVPYDSKTVQMPDGEMIEGVFPDFDEVYAVQLPEEMYLESDRAQFLYCNQQLAYEIDMNPELAEQFTSGQLEQIRNGETPEGYVWHHAEEPGRMELVDEKTHAKSGHVGGRELWGGGSEYR